MMPSSAERVATSTDDRINRRIERELLQRLYYYREHTGEIDERLAELDGEWDIERALETNASALISASLLWSLLSGRRSLLLAAGVSAFLLQHALQGWCPPLPLLRRLGFRTTAEIETERYALRILRGDLDSIRGDSELETTLAMLQRRDPRRQSLH
jgi:hypothetical protein